MISNFILLPLLHHPFLLPKSYVQIWLLVIIHYAIRLTIICMYVWLFIIKIILFFHFCFLKIFPFSFPITELLFHRILHTASNIGLKYAQRTNMKSHHYILVSFILSRVFKSLWLVSAYLARASMFWLIQVCWFWLHSSGMMRVLVIQQEIT